MALTLALAAGCGGNGGAADAGRDAFTPDAELVDAEPPDAGPADGGGADASADLPPAAAYLPASRYDCTASGPFEAPERPHALGCYADPDCTDRLIAAHRLATAFAPENSLSALRAAILLGVDIVETDIRQTADGHVVLMHDSDVDRTTDGSGPVGEMTLDEVRSLALVPGPGTAEGDFSCDRVPTLEEALALAQGQVIVELEVKDRAAGAQAAAYLRDEELYDAAFLLCDPDECAALRAEAPDAPIMSRPQEASQVADEVAYDPPPILVHIDVDDAFLADDVVGTIHGAGAKVYGNAFANADGEAALLGELDGYSMVFDRGVEVLQTQFPHWALMAIGRLDRP